MLLILRGTSWVRSAVSLTSCRITKLYSKHCNVWTARSLFTGATLIADNVVPTFFGQPRIAMPRRTISAIWQLRGISSCQFTTVTPIFLLKFKASTQKKEIRTKRNRKRKGSKPYSYVSIFKMVTCSLIHILKQIFESVLRYPKRVTKVNY